MWDGRGWRGWRDRDDEDDGDPKFEKIVIGKGQKTSVNPCLRDGGFWASEVGFGGLEAFT